MGKQRKIKQLGKGQHRRLAASLFKRRDLRKLGAKKLRELFPDAPNSAINATVLHLYVELPDALLALLAEIELSLREPMRSLNPGTIWHCLYHLHNSSQLATLLPWGRTDVATEVQEIHRALENGDREFAMRGLERLSRRLGGSDSPPNLSEAD